MNNELRRAKEKLAVLDVTDAPIKQVLFDIIEIVAPGQYGEKTKLAFISLLDLEYREKIQQLTPKSKHKQQKLFDNDSGEKL